MHEMTRPEIEEWRKEQLARSRFEVRELSQDALRDWSFKNGRLVHSTGGFFTVAGLRYHDRDHPGVKACQPFILQPEVGILGFVVTRRDGEACLLVQAKTEPGNPGGVQLAPTFQATESNYRQRHGGSCAPFHEYFHVPGTSVVLADSRQSEQGTRFLDKYNRNMLVEVEFSRVADALPGREAWRLMTMADVRRHIVGGLLFNTDARSVIAVADWKYFCDEGRPFERHADTPGIGHELWRSYGAVPSPAEAEDILRWLKARQETFRAEPEVVPLEGMPGWDITEAGVIGTTANSVSARYYGVQALDREVPHWSQPLLTSGSQGTVLLLMQVRDGVLRLLAGLSHEPGFGNAAQLSASFQKFAGDSREGDPLLVPGEWGVSEDAILLDCLMSDEGGRFFHELNRYVLAVAPPDARIPEDDDHRWLTLGEITALKHIPGVFTNEFRSALSLLVHYL